MVKLTDEMGTDSHFLRSVVFRGKRSPTRWVLEAVLWILTGAQWMLPQCYPNYKTVHRRFQTWCRHEDSGIRRCELRERGGTNQRVSTRCSRRRRGVAGGRSDEARENWGSWTGRGSSRSALTRRTIMKSRWCS